MIAEVLSPHSCCMPLEHSELESRKEYFAKIDTMTFHQPSWACHLTSAESSAAEQQSESNIPRYVPVSNCTRNDM